MFTPNKNFKKLSTNYLFAENAKKIAEFETRTGKTALRLGIGDVTRPLVPAVVAAMKRAAEEMGKQNCNAAFVEAFKRTSIQTVLEKMTAPEQVILRPGIFPGTAAGVEEHFALVSIDVDFEQSTLAGLEFFYPRLSPGGYLLIHDYNSRLAGVAEAVARFERKLGRNVAKVPLCDRSGTCVITR